MQRRVLLGSIAMAIAAGVACERVPENSPQLASFDGTRPALDQNSGPDGSAIDFDTYCGGDPVVAQGQACDTSFATDVYPLLTAKSPGGCTDGVTCHGVAEVTFGGPLGVSAADTWNRLILFKFRNRTGEPLPYVNICSNDPDQSAITCNLNFDAACGNKMPKDRTELDGAEKQIIENWLKCGAPNN